MSTINSDLSIKNNTGFVGHSNPLTPRLPRRFIVTHPQLDQSEPRVPSLHHKSQSLDNNTGYTPSSVSKWDALRFQRKFNPRKGMRLCGMSAANHNGSHSVRIEKKQGQRADFKNIQLCGSHWCPTCSEKFRVDKRRIIRDGLNSAISSGFYLYFIL